MFIYCIINVKKNLNIGGSYTDSPDCIKIKKATINRINKRDNKCFQYAVTVVLNHEEIKKDPQRIRTLKPFINKYNWEGVNFLSEKDDCKKYLRKIIKQLLLMFCMSKKYMCIYLIYVSKHNLNCEKQVILSVISNGEKREAKSKGRQWHYTAIKTL